MDRGLLIVVSLGVALTGCELVGGGGGPCAKYDGDAASINAWRSPTNLEVDCRCSQTIFDEPLCRTPDTAKGLLGNLGEGPALHKMGGSKIRNGELWEDRNEIIVAVSFASNSPGMVMGVDIDTGDRRIISGSYLDPARGWTNVGEGPDMPEPTYALRGPDDMLYVYGHETVYVEPNQEPRNSVFRLDPDTGEREMVWQWKNDDYGQCTREDGTEYQLALEGRGFDVGPDGEFYFTTIGVRAVIKISPDRQDCEIVTSPDLGVGEGWGMGIAIEEVQEVGGTLFIMDNDALVAIDPANGDRIKVAGGVGPGQLQYDETRNMLHLTGIHAPYDSQVWSLDLETGYVWEFKGCDVTPEGHPYAEDCIARRNVSAILNEHQAWVLPGGENMITVNYLTDFLLVEMATGNAHHFSF